jgi:putative glutamine amidotransferase
VVVSAYEGARRPVIGLTTYSERARMLVWDREFAMLHASYLAATERAGGIAVLLPAPGAQPEATGAEVTGAEEVIDRAEEVLNRVDGLVLTGGADVDPARYGQPRQERTSAPRVQRDQWEIALATVALGRRVPLLAVCRGLQILNVALGGSLHQHLPDVIGHDGHQPAPGTFGAVEVNIEPGTRTAELIGPRVRVRCHHHQAVERLAPGLTVTGRAADGTVEAVEVAGPSFAVAVQWHPEEDHEDARLFAALVAAGRQYATRPAVAAQRWLRTDADALESASAAEA